MRYVKPKSEDLLPYSNIKISGCASSNVEFTFLEKVPVTRARRYCNKMLVHECVEVPQEQPLDLDWVEFVATADPCYGFIDIYKTSRDDMDSSSESSDDPASSEESSSSDVISPTIDLVYNIDGLVTNVLVKFTFEDTCCVPMSMAYKLNGYKGETKELLSYGRLYVTPCRCCCEGRLWIGVEW